MTKKSHLATFVYQMFAYGKTGLGTFARHSGKTPVATRFPRPCLECGRDHVNTNAFCSAFHAKEWRARNPNQSRTSFIKAYDRKLRDKRAAA